MMILVRNGKVFQMRLFLSDPIPDTQNNNNQEFKWKIFFLTHWGTSLENCVIHQKRNVPGNSLMEKETRILSLMERRHLLHK